MQIFRQIVQQLSISRFLLLITILNLVQAAFTELSADEAYYWYYAQDLSWGYLDHPPAIALYVFIGDKLARLFQIIGSPFFVRLITVISFSVAVYVLWQLVRKHTTIQIFAAVVLSFVLLHFFGFVATPDSPLLLSTALFCLAYRNFLQKSTWQNCLWLGASMAAMMYCKYHALLFIVFVLLGNLTLLRNTKAWVAVLFALLLFIPHLWWQFVHQYPSLQFHLKDRATAFKWFYIIEYLGNIIVSHAMIALPAIIFVVRQKYDDAFYNSLRTVVIGFVAFFLWATTRGHVQPQWLMMCVPPLIILLCTQSSGKYFKFINYAAVVNIIVQLVMRLVLLSPQKMFATDFHGNKAMALAIKAANTQKLPVVFHDSYQNASLYQFYTGDTNVYNTYSYYGRASQHQIRYQSDEHLHQKLCFLCFKIPTVNTVMLPLDNGKLRKVYCKEANYYAYDRIKLKNASLTQDRKLQAKLYNPYTHPIRLDSASELQLSTVSFDGDIVLGSLATTVSPTDIMPLQSKVCSWQIDSPTFDYSKLSHMSVFFIQKSGLEGPRVAQPGIK